MFNIFKKSDQSLITKNTDAKQRDDEIMASYVQAMDSGQQRPTLTNAQMQAHLREASIIEDTRNTLIDRGYYSSPDGWTKG